ncbi:hypothetical protein GW17_00048889 [Ensete ventricosum]|nr:hypothetical protein GW17_00048889 [Ensete ventricosum]
MDRGLAGKKKRRGVMNSIFTAALPFGFPNSPGTVLLTLYKQLLWCGAKPNCVTLSLVLKACPDLEALGLVMGVHAQSLALGFRSETLVLNSLIHAYTACGSIGSANGVFDELPDRDRIAWTRLINGYVRSGRAREAVDLFLGMMEANVRPDEVSIVAACTSCSQLSPAPSPLVLVWVLFARGGKYT